MAISHRSKGRAGGFTLVELLLVVVIAALASSMVAFALRDGDADRLEREAVRLAALLEAARAASRAGGVAVAFMAAPAEDAAAADFRFVGLPAGTSLPRRWLSAGVSMAITPGPAVALGPEPVIGAQRVELRLGEQRVALASDGLGPFVPSPVSR